MRKSDLYLIELLYASIKEDYYPSNDISDVDFERILKISAMSRVSNCVYYGLLKLDKETLKLVPNLETFKQECLIYGVKEKIQETEILDIINTFNKENIDILFFKGYVLKYIFPKIDMRVMGDIDFLVEKKDIEKAQKILENIGFVKNNVLEFNVEVSYKRNIEVELHKKLSTAELKYFDDAWKHKEKFLDYPNTYTLDPHYHFVFLLSHALEHVKHGGLGLKYPMDFYLFLTKYDIDFNVIKKELIKNKLDKFAKLILLICNKWFKLSLDKYQDFIGDFICDEKVMETFEIFILSGGEYGANRNIYTVQKAAQKNKFRFLMSKIFRPFRYVVKTDHPKWWQYILLPFYYLRHWFIFFILRGRLNVKKAKSYTKDDENISDLEKLFKQIDVR